MKTGTTTKNKTWRCDTEMFANLNPKTIAQKAAQRAVDSWAMWQNWG